MAKPDREVAELEHLMRLANVSAYEASRRAGNMAPSNWSRWFNHGMSPTLAKFSKFRGAVIDLAEEKGALPAGSRSKALPELIELAKGWRA